ncbi:hypothetical protein HK104_000632 [Borealophlyctis nickersoniae]|nr:hypothetical protein HK104_000632 [Borealophlyctis nickersoniae]
MNYDSTLVRIPTASSSDQRSPSKPPKAKLIPRDPWAKAAVGWALSQFLLITLLEIIVATRHYNYTTDAAVSALLGDAGNQNSRALTLYHGLFIASQAFQLFLCFDAVVHSSMIQLVSTTTFNWALFGYSCMQYRQAMTIFTDAQQKVAETQNIPVHPTRVVEIVIIICMLVFSLGWIAISYRLYRVFGWSIFKELGADIAVKNRLRQYHIYMMLLKLDVFFFLGFDLQFLVLVLILQSSTDKTDVWTHAGVAIPFTLGLLIVAYFAIRRESNWLMALTLLGLSGGIGYLISKLVDVQTNKTNKYQGSKNSLTFFEAITLILSIATFVVGIFCFRNFGKGLKEQLHKARNPNLEMDDFNRLNNKDPHRWSLD